MAETAKGVRARARAQLVAEIKASARRQLAADGAAGLSLRAIARELEMASSAIYRYFPSRDDLLTALIVDAYGAVGEAVERAAVARPHAPLLDRWRMVCRAVRDWAVANPHEYALVYGSPVPGYRAPPDTVDQATRVTAVLAGLVVEGTARGDAAPPAPGDVDDALHTDGLRALLPGVPPDVITRAVIAWTELFGLVSFEVFGHLVGTTTAYDALFDRAITLMGRYVGLSDE
jgi:AcrR family transcriptional regulator